MMPSMRTSAMRGYTLIEILVVMFIISIVTSIAVLSIHVSDDKRIKAVANDIAQMLSLAEEQALLEPNVLGLYVSGSTYEFKRLQVSQQNKQESWQSLQDPVMGKHVLPDNMAVVIKTQGTTADEKTEQAAHPQIIVSTNGDMTPFVMYIGKTGQKPQYVITGDADGNLTTRSLS